MWVLASNPFNSGNITTFKLLSKGLEHIYTHSKEVHSLKMHGVTSSALFLSISCSAAIFPMVNSYIFGNTHINQCVCSRWAYTWAIMWENYWLNEWHMLPSVTFVMPGDVPVHLRMPNIKLLDMLKIICEMVGDKQEDRKFHYQKAKQAKASRSAQVFSWFGVLKAHLA